jgi:hypothetical protein
MMKMRKIIKVIFIRLRPKDTQRVEMIKLWVALRGAPMAQ